MKTIKNLLCLFLFSQLLSLASCARDNIDTVPSNLRCEYLQDPIGLDVASPRFTWAFDSNGSNFVQKSYQLYIASSPELLLEGEADVWNSGKIKSSETFVQYTGDRALNAHTRYYWTVVAWDAQGGRCMNAPIAIFETAKMSPSDWVAQWITDANDMEVEAAPMFRKDFELSKEVKSARVYVSGTGYYELFINGARVGDHYLDPGYTHFDKRILYVTHDVTPLLLSGQNAVGAVLGNGFANIQSKAVWDFERASWRKRPRLLCEIRIQYTDGTTETIATDANWQTTTGPYTYNNIYSGDRYDSRLEQEGWADATFDHSGWEAVQCVEAPAPILVAQTMPAIRIVREVEPISVKSFGNKTYVYDMGENITGFCRIKVKGVAGTRISIRHGELLKADGRMEPGNIDVYYKPEKPGEVFQEDIFILKGTGAEEEFTPSFAYHGFEYVEINSSHPIELTKESLTGLFMHTDIERVGNFSCSNQLLNKIYDATMKSYQCNIHSIPTDCPQREKNGWTADAHVAIDLALLNYDGITFYEKWMDDFIDNQTPEGGICGIIPSSGWGYGTWPGPVWDAAMFIIPNALYDYYGDTAAIEALYPAYLRYFEYLKTKEVAGGLNYGLGDWVYYKATTNNEYTSTAYYYYDYKAMARFAKLLGKDATAYETRANELKALLNKKFFNPATGIYAEGTQTAQALALYLEIVPTGKEQLVADKLHEVVANNNYFLDFGLLGSKTVPAMLTKYGYVADAMQMITKTDAPSWGHMVETMGRNTLGETWIMNEQFHDASLNHVFLGDVSAWMTNCLAGINYDTTQPGFRHIIIRPYFVENLDWVKGAYQSTNGMIRSEWKRDNNNVVLTVTIPANTTATVCLDKEEKIGSGVHIFTIAQ